jgi:hypothetical protein
MGLLKSVKRKARVWMQIPEAKPAPLMPGDKAPPEDFLGRFREIVSDPLNLLIDRDPRAGVVEDGLVWLHNGNRVPVEGEGAYYGRLSEILIINRGVHEPLEEYVFQELMRILPDNPMMLELGAYWSHYSMWMKRLRPHSKVFMIEPSEENIKAGRANFARNGFDGEFIRSMVGRQSFKVDRFLSKHGYPRLDLLHSDIQGYETEMLEGCAESFRRELVDYAFISTHSEALHGEVVESLSRAGMRVEVSSGFDAETTSYDGFVFASRAAKAPVFSGFAPMGRRDIVRATPEKVVSYLANIVRSGPSVAR